MVQEEKIVELLKRAKSGDALAFEEFILLSENILRREIKNLGVSASDVDDILQETIWKIWSNLERLETDKNPVGWITTIARNTTISFLRKYRRISFVDPSKLSYISSGIDNGKGGNTVFEQDLSQLKNLLSQLPEKHRKAVEMRYLKNMSYEEIAKILKTSPTNARQLVSRGIKKLKKLAEANENGREK